MKKQRKNKINLISKIVYIILLIISVLLFGILIRLNLLPMIYLILGLIVYGFILILMGIVAFRKKFKIWIKMFINFISVILIVVLLVVLYYLNTTINFMDKIKADKYQIENYYVLINTSSKYEDIKELNNKDIGLIESNTENYKNALKDLNKQISYKESKYVNYLDLGKDLLNNKLDAILLSESHKSLCEDLIKDFDLNVKIIYTIGIKTETKVESSNIDINKDSFNVYISGIDIYGDISSVSRSDVNMIMTVNPNTHNILLTSIPRDYYVQLHGTTGLRDKLTHAGMYGINMSIETIEDLLDEDIDYYIRVNFTTLINLVDAIGGIDIYSDTEFVAWTNRSCKFEVGSMHLDGACALAYSRERYAYLEGDRHRVQNQQDVLTAIINKALSSTTLITKYSKLLESMGDSIQISIPSNSIYSLINSQLKTMPSWTIKRYSLNGTDKLAKTYSAPSEDLYVMEPDTSTVELAIKYIDGIMEGKSFTEIGL